MRPLPSLLVTALVLGLSLPFLGKPPHVDDANFLALAEGAAAQPWRPHDVLINWQGSTERAFDVLSNPPGIAWWLAPVHDASPAMQHLAMLPWLGLALWGAGRLGRALADDAVGGALVLGTAPVAVLATQALTPDLPLYACALAGVGGFLTGRRPGLWALVAGCAALFRYSGVCLIPLLLLAGLQRRRAGAALLSALPLGLLFLHDLHAYGEVHLLAMAGFQSVANTPDQSSGRGPPRWPCSAGWGCSPCCPGGVGAGFGALAGGLLGLAAASHSGHEGGQRAVTVAFCVAGGMALANLRLRRPEDRLLTAWTLGGLGFLLTLRFTAARYWLPFLPGPALAALRLRPSPPALAAAVGLNALVALGLSVDDDRFARAHHQAAAQVAALAPTGTFAGHWGWQHALEEAGWRPLEEDGAPGALHAVAQAPWPQRPDPEACLTPILAFALPDRWWGPRVHSAGGVANLHAFLVAGDPPVETYAPWTFSEEPYDRVTVFRRCDGPPTSAPSPSEAQDLPPAGAGGIMPP